MKQAAFKQTAAGKYRKLKARRQDLLTRTETGQKSDNTSTNEMEKLMAQLRTTWGKSSTTSQTRDKFIGLLQALDSDEGKAFIRKVTQRVKDVWKKLPVKGVINAMEKDQLNNLLKNLEDGVNPSDLLQTMMNDPAMKQTAMDMMQEMMSDEKKLAEMTEMMFKMLKKE